MADQAAESTEGGPEGWTGREACKAAKEGESGAVRREAADAEA